MSYVIKAAMFFVLLWTGVHSGIIVHNIDTSKKYPLQTFGKKNIEYTELSSLSEALGYICNYNAFDRTYTCFYRGGSNQTITFVEGNRFVIQSNSVVVQLVAAPVFINGSICVPVKSIPEMFSTGESKVKWGSNDSTITVKGQSVSAKASVSIFKKGIVSVHSSVKENGTLLAITLSDSLSFDYMYYHPSMILNFYGGVVDTEKIKIDVKNGIVKSVSSVQFKESAQISIMLSSEVEEPVFDYIQDTKTILVSLRPLKRQLEKFSKPQPVPQPAPSKKGTIIVIDPGHGGKDPGAIGHDDIKEKDVVLSISLKLRDLLKKTPGITVLLTRDKDVFIPLSDRTKFANDKKADVFISIHADAVPGDAKRKKSTKGYKIYFLSQAKNEEDKMAAMRENAVIQLEEKPQNYSNIQNVLIDLAGNEFLRASQDLCILVDQKFSEKLKKEVKKLHLGVGQANFWVLNGAYMPSVLVETGFLSHPQESKLLTSKSFQKSMALALSEAIISFSKQYGAEL